MKILVLTSGGDNPGLNTFLAELYKHHKDTYACIAGYKGLINGNIKPLSSFHPEKYAKSSGSIIKSSRCPEFKEEKYFKKGLENAKKYDVLIILGGNGSYQGAKELAQNGMRTIFVPSTIDNDVLYSEYSLGFHSAVKGCCQLIEKTMPTMDAFNRCAVFETMGRRCGDIAKTTAKVVGADYCITEEKDIDYAKISKAVKAKQKINQASCVIIRENIIDIRDFTKKLQQTSGVETRGIVVGYIQRGIEPTKLEIKIAKKFARIALKTLKKAKNSYSIGINQGKFNAHVLQ